MRTSGIARRLASEYYKLFSGDILVNKFINEKRYRSCFLKDAGGEAGVGSSPPVQSLP